MKSQENHQDKSPEELLPLQADKQLNIEPNISPFSIKPFDLEEIFNICQRRSKCEEVDYLIEHGGLSLLTSPDSGITSVEEDLQNRIRVYGSNKRVIRPPKSYMELLCAALEDFTMRVLMVAAALSIIIETSTAHAEHRNIAWIEGFAILIAVLVCSNVAAFNDYSKEQQFRKLNEKSSKEKMVTVLRDKNPYRIHEDDVLVGDLVKLVEGMVCLNLNFESFQQIPADGILIEASEIYMDESSMTGETHLIKKTTIQKCLSVKQEIDHEGRVLGEQDRYEIPSPALLSGTKVLEGEGLFIACTVGDNSCEGKIRAALEQEDDDQTPLQIKLTAIAEDIGKFGLGAAILIVLAMLIRFAVERIQENAWDNSKHWEEILSFFIIGIVVVAVAIPEGLPLAVTLSLAYSVQKMANDKNLVRKLYACEVMGGADAICSDKTGTLTMNKMQLTQLWNQNFHDIDILAKEQNVQNFLVPTMQKLFTQSLCCNSSAELVNEKTKAPETGSKTEIAILDYLLKAGFDYRQVKESVTFLQKMPFNSSRKRMSVIVETVENGIPRKRLYVKGASEIVVESIDKMHDFKDKVIPVTEGIRQNINAAILTMAKKALRTICVAYRDLDGTEDLTKQSNKIYDVESSNLTFLCILGIMDNLRKGVKDAVTTCKFAGITVRMVTGDNKDTARAIAIQCGIINEGDTKALVVEGPEFVNDIGGIICKYCKTQRCNCAKSQKEADDKKVIKGSYD